ncbi:MAG: HAD family hydrolase [Acidimicrobiales bacterium]|nr:HAD family hydrolase [Acidimicrobiales bacterium]
MTDLLVGGDQCLKGIQAVLFDKDGTLIDIHHYWASMIRLRADLISVDCFGDGVRASQVADYLVDAMGVDLKTGRMKPDGPVGVKPRPEIVAVAASVVRAEGVNISCLEVETLFAEIDRRTESDFQPLLRTLPGVRNILRSLSDAGVAVAVVTTDLTSRARQALNVLDLGDWVDLVLGGDSVAVTKPAPDLAMAAIGHLAVDAARSVVIGDHPVDVQMGEAAGCGAAVAVLTGLASRAAFDGESCVVVPDLTYLSLTKPI